MGIGTSDGSDFGGAGHDGPTRFSFCRLDLIHPERNVSIAVFPHGRNGGLRRQIEQSARRTGLEPQYVWADDQGEEQFVHRISSADPWGESYDEMPAGYYPKATGDTTYGAVCWKIPKKRGGHLEISYVTWRFFETADFTTSIVVKIVPPLYETQQEIAGLKGVATKITSKLTTWLQDAPPSPAAVLLRKQLSG